MEDNKKAGANSTQYDIGGPNHIKLPYNKCGCVYKVQLNHLYNAHSMSGLVCGALNTNASEALTVGGSDNSCSLDGISMPDNVGYMDGLNTLIIGEDTVSLTKKLPRGKKINKPAHALP